VRRTIRGIALGLALAAAPLVAAAQEPGAVPPPPDAGVVILVTLLALGGLLLAVVLGYLYRQVMRLDWDFQKPDEPHADGHAEATHH
jgi:ABC-type nitrate/sulfonate/bicarbonate transport system substrate-binding protein